MCCDGEEGWKGSVPCSGGKEGSEIKNIEWSVEELRKKSKAGQCYFTEETN